MKTKKVKDIMTENPVCCPPDTTLRDVARLMVENDCGCIPIVESNGQARVVGVITDRDICCRAVAQGKNPLELKARDIMSTPVTSVRPEDSLEDCCEEMERHQVRRLPVIDARGECCGVIAQADIARDASKTKTGEVVREVSKPAPQYPRAAF